MLRRKNWRRVAFSVLFIALLITGVKTTARTPRTCVIAALVASLGLSARLPRRAPLLAFVLET
jgi:hypothetical protein